VSPRAHPPLLCSRLRKSSLGNGSLDLYVKLKEPGVGERHVGMPACGRLRRTALTAAVAALAFVGAAPARASTDAPRDFWGVVPISELS
jgi:hypothetical protein